MKLGLNHSSPKVYLAGPIAGTTYDGCTEWRGYVQGELARDGILGYSPMRAKERLKALEVMGYEYDTLDGKNSPLTSARGITTRDRFDCTTCDLLFVNFFDQPDRVSIGTVMEVAWADAHRIPIVMVIQDEGNIHDHPILRECVGFRTPSIEEAVAITKAVLLP